MTTGTVYKFTIDMYPLSALFKSGHCIRLALTSSSIPKWYPNGNTGKELDEDMPGVVTTNTIYHDADRPSRMVLPIIPSGSAAPTREK